MQLLLPSSRWLDIITNINVIGAIRRPVKKPLWSYCDMIFRRADIEKGWLFNSF